MHLSEVSNYDKIFTEALLSAEPRLFLFHKLQVLRVLMTDMSQLYIFD